MTQPRAFRQQVNLLVARNLSPQAMSARLAQFAKSELKRVQAAGASPDYRRYVDGVRDAPEESVKPGGAIVYRFNLMAQAAALAVAELRKRAPVGKGPINPRKAVQRRYKDSFFLGLNGKFVMASDFNPRTANSLSNVVVGNVQPYSRKADVQFVGNRQLNYSVEPQFFEAAARVVRSRFPNLDVKRVYSVTFPGQYKLQQRQMRTGKQSHRIKRHTGELVESPSIIIKPR